MGIDIGNAQWAYSGFMRFREKLALADGITLRQMDSFGGDQPWENADGKDITILRPFLDHSDCDGELTWQECEQVVDRIEQIIDSWRAPEGDFTHGRDISQGKLLVAEMRDCIRTKTVLEFT